jgi:hypothetical protein
MKLREAVAPSYRVRANGLPGRDVTLIFVYQDVHNPRAFEDIPEMPGKFRISPLFDAPGSVELTLYDGEESLGSETITVRPCPSEAMDALRLLNPPLPGETRGPRDRYLWSLLVATSNFSPPLTEREIRMLQDQLPVMKRHPDWAEILEMRLACVVAWHYLRQVTDQGMSRLLDDVQSPEFPEHVVNCLQHTTEGAFARAIQDTLKDRCATLTYLRRDRERQLESNRRP